MRLFRPDRSLALSLGYESRFPHRPLVVLVPWTMRPAFLLEGMVVSLHLLIPFIPLAIG